MDRLETHGYIISNLVAVTSLGELPVNTYGFPSVATTILVPMDVIATISESAVSLYFIGHACG